MKYGESAGLFLKKLLTVNLFQGKWNLTNFRNGVIGVFIILGIEVALSIPLFCIMKVAKPQLRFDGKSSRSQVYCFRR